MTKPSSTAEQLRSLMNSHISMATAPTLTAKPTTITTVQVKPATQTATVLSPVDMRQTIRLISPELSQINMIISNTLERTGKRATVTDVLRMGLKRLGESAHLTLEELKLLRTTDGRRNKLRA